MTYKCPKCGTTGEQAGNCPSCGTPMVESAGDGAATPQQPTEGSPASDPTQ